MDDVFTEWPYVKGGELVNGQIWQAAVEDKSSPRN